MAFHQDPLGALRDGSTAEGAFEIVILGEPPQHDVDRALPILGFGVGDIGEDAALRGLFDKPRIGGVDEQDHWAGRFLNDPLDQAEGMLRALS